MKHHSDLSFKEIRSASGFGMTSFSVLAALVFPAFLFLSCGREGSESPESVGIEVRRVQAEQAGIEAVPSNSEPIISEETRPVSASSVADPAPDDAPAAEKRKIRVTEVDLRIANSVESYIPKSVYSSGMEFEYVYYDGSPTPDSITLCYVPDPGEVDFVVPDGVTAVHTNAFQDCKKLKSVTFPDSVKSIGELALDNIPSLKSVSLPARITIGNSAFYQCSGLETVTFRKDPEGAQSSPGSVVLGKEVFSLCNKMKHFAFPEGLEAIPEGALCSCAELESIAIPEGVKEIGPSAFKQCTAIREIRIPDSVVKIEGAAFSGCIALEEIVLPLDHPVFLDGGGVFYECTSLRHLTLPPPRTIWLVDNTFRGCTALESIEIPEGIEVIGYSAFAGCTSLKTVKLPESVHEIRRGAFAGCKSLENIIMPANGRLKVIELYAFHQCENLKTVTIPGRIELLENAFDLETTRLKFLSPANKRFRYMADGSLIDYEKKILIGVPVTLEGEYEVPEGIRKIASRAFESCRVERVTIPDSVTSIGGEAFKSSAIREITIPASVTNLEEGHIYGEIDIRDISAPRGMFNGCTELKRAKLKGRPEKIPDYLFQGCASLEEVSLPEGITEIPAGMFRRCKGLKRIELPEGVRTIGSSAFEGCTGLKRIELPEGVRTINYRAFEGCTGLEEVVLSPGISRINGSAFKGCKELKRVVLPEGLTFIGSMAFGDCRSLKEIAIPASVTKIYPGAFDGAGCEQYIKEHYGHLMKLILGEDYFI